MVTDLARQLEEWTTEEWRTLEADLAEMESQLPRLAVAAQNLAKVCERITERFTQDRYVRPEPSPLVYRYVCLSCHSLVRAKGIWLDRRSGRHVCDSCKDAVTGKAG